MVPKSVSYFAPQRYFYELTLSYRFINSMPMIFAFRIMDCFFCMGPKVLFQVGLVGTTLRQHRMYD